MKSFEDTGKSWKAKNFRNKIEKDDRELTDKYKESESFSETIKDLEEIIKREGFKGLVILPEGNGIGTGGFRDYCISGDNIEDRIINLFRTDIEKVYIGEGFLKNIQDILKFDREFAVNGITNLIKHEKQHRSGPDLRAEEEAIKRTERVVNSQKDEIEDRRTLGKLIIETLSEDYSQRELQAELQRVNANYKDLDEFIDSQARFHVFMDVINFGIDNLDNFEYDPDKDELRGVHFGFIKEKIENDGKEIELHKVIIKRMKEVKKDLDEKWRKEVAG
ncbi:MAG: hypothetical protein KAQ64_01805 [Candidatus Pacebacteria bacterium]|nr:hypothetical protein [Candidatus Paceibacterota bacterium]